MICWKVCLLYTVSAICVDKSTCSIDSQTMWVPKKLNNKMCCTVAEPLLKLSSDQKPEFIFCLSYQAPWLLPSSWSCHAFPHKMCKRFPKKSTWNVVLTVRIVFHWKKITQGFLWQLHTPCSKARVRYRLHTSGCDDDKVLATWHFPELRRKSHHSLLPKWRRWTWLFSNQPTCADKLLLHYAVLNNYSLGAYTINHLQI